MYFGSSWEDGVGRSLNMRTDGEVQSHSLAQSSNFATNLNIQNTDNTSHTHTCFALAVEMHQTQAGLFAHEHTLHYESNSTVILCASM